MHLVNLFVAIVFEVIATSALKAANGFTVLVPSVIVVIGYALAFYFLGISLRTIPVGIAYAIWAGLGVVLVAVVGAVVYQQVPDLPAMIGMALILAGVLIINLVSKSVTH